MLTERAENLKHSQFEDFQKNAKALLKAEEEVLATAKELFFAFDSHGHPTEVVLAGCLYTAGHINKGKAIPANLITDAFGIHSVNLRQIHLTLKRKLKLSVEPRRPKDYLASVRLNYPMSDEVVEKAIDLSEKFIGKTNQQFSPVVIMLAALFIAARMNGTPITQQRLAKYGAHELSIRNCAKKILEVLGIPREQIRRELAYDAGKNRALERLESRINDLDISKESKDSVLKEIKEVKKSFHPPQSGVKEAERNAL